MDAIKQADLIVIGPGDMYSSILPCFLPKGMPETVRESKAKKIFICPPMTKFGETNNFSVLDFVNEVEKYLGCKLDSVIYNLEIPSEERVNKFKEEEPSVYRIVEINNGLDENKFIGSNLLAESEQIVYNPDKISEVIMKTFG